jgi:hypothetical protein
MGNRRLEVDLSVLSLLWVLFWRYHDVHVDGKTGSS